MEEEDKSADAGADALIAGLTPEVALSILARLPCVLYPRLRCVCRAWNHAFRPSGSVISYRRTLGMLQAWPLIYVLEGGGDYLDIIDTYRWYALDPHDLSLHPTPSHPPCHNLKEVFGSECGCGFVMYRSTIQASSYLFHAFDASGMQWQNFEIPLMPPQRSDFAYALLDDYLYAVSGHPPEDPVRSCDFWGMVRADASKSVDRIHIGNRNMLSSSSWEGIPDMHHPRACSHVIPRQGCLYVLGGRSEYYGEDTGIYSGEVWNPRTEEWTLMPQMWPFKVFGDHRPSEILAAVVMGTLFALKLLSRELMCYHDGKQEWVNVGQVPVEITIDGVLCHRLVGVGSELWFFCDRDVPCDGDGYDEMSMWFYICISDVAAALLSGTLFDTPPANLSWKVLRSKFEYGMDVSHGNVVHV